MNRYLLFTTFTGFLEIGIVLLALQHWPQILWLPALFGLAYQLGAPLASRIPSPLFILAATDCAFVALAIYLDSPVFLFPVITALSWRIQGARDQNKIPTPTHKKRLFRVAGFICGTLVLFPFTPFVAWIVICLTLALAKPESFKTTPAISPKSSWGPWSFVMVTHQMQYFTYVYGIFWVLHTQGNLALHWLSAAFAAGWISYLLVEPVIKSRRYRLILISGHLLLVLVLMLLAAETFPSLTLLLWIITGLGGGTVYCIKHLLPPDESLDIAEEIGHFLGPTLAIFLLLLTSTWSSTLWTAAIFASCTVILAALSPLETTREDQS